jgi:hypothetical protein
VPSKSTTVISDASRFQGFKLLERFQDIFAGLDARRTKSPRELDPRRKFDAAEYFSMVLFTLLNPVIETTRGLCEASKLKEYQRRTSLPKVSLGSFSEAQGVFDPELLSAVLRELMVDIAGDPPASLARAMRDKKLEAIDSSLWEVLPRMGWAHWRDQFSSKQNAVRLHLRWRLFESGVGGAKLVAARECERSVLRHGLLEPGVVYVGDRNYSGDYELLRRMDEVGASFVVRLQDQSVIEEIQRIPVSEEDRERGITHHQRVALGCRNAKDNGWRLVRLVRGPGREHIVILTNLPLEEVGAWELCEIYKLRWTIELFFRWLKCLLPCRHWLAESRNGVAIQVYCALIAALLLSRHSGKLPTKRMMEMLRFWMMGWADDDELAAALGPAKIRN